MRRLFFTVLLLTVSTAGAEAPFGSGDLYGGATGFGPSTTAESPWPWVGAAAVVAAIGFALRARANHPGAHWVGRSRARRRHRQSVARLRLLEDSYAGLEPEALRSRFHSLVHQNVPETAHRDEIRRRDHLKITGLWFDHVEPQPRPAITVLLQARAADYYVDSEGRWKRGRPVIEPFQEFWTFKLEAGTWRITEIKKA